MLSDGGGLYLSVSPAGLKSWVVRVRLPGTTTATPSTIGHYPGKVMQEWADYLDALRIGNDVVQLRKRA
jgi:hypothetical protein